MTRAFKIESWDESPYLELENDSKYSIAKLVKTYSGQFSGAGQLQYLMAYNESGAAYFTGIEHFDGSIDGFTGSLSMSHEGRFANDTVESTFKVIEGSQTGDLTNLLGEGSYATGHSMTVYFDFNYELN